MYTLIHTHGIGQVDFSSFSPSDLRLIQERAHDLDEIVVPGVFLRREFLDGMFSVLDEYNRGRERFSNIAGFSIEGPLLGNAGGVPPAGIWSPSAEEWLRIAGWGDFGLRYVVMAPDGADLDDDLGGLSFRELIDTFYRNGVRIALGHFQRHDHELSARRTADVINHIHSTWGPSPDVLLTDHLYNDMPKRFTHVWRTPEARAVRESELAAVLKADWHRENLEQLLGPVPALLINAAIDKKLMLFLNFDGDHVDLEICRKTIAAAGSANLIGITDDTEIPFLAGEHLHQEPGNSLWYRQDGIVAAGTGHLPQQIENLRSMGCSEAEIEALFVTNPQRALSPLVLALK